MPATLSPNPYFTVLDSSGNPISGGKIATYESGTSTPLAVYHDADLSSAWTNPAVADSAGRITMYLLPAAYKFEVMTAANVVFATIDPVGSVPATAVSLDVDIIAGETLLANDAIYMSTGGGGDPGTAGLWYKTDADNAYSSTAAQSVGIATTAIANGANGTARLQGTVTGFVGLTAGAVYYLSGTAGGITASAPTNARAIGQADSTTTLVVSAIVPPMATASVAGLISLAAQTLGAGLKNFGEAPTGLFRFARCTSTLTKNANITPDNVTGMSFSIAANEVLAFQFYVYCASAAAAGHRFDITGPAAPTAVWYGAPGFSSIAASPNAIAAFGGDICIASVGATVATEAQMVMIAGLIRNGSTAGTIQVRYAQAVSTASDSVALVESFGVAWRQA